MTTICNENTISDISSTLKILIDKIGNISGSELAKRTGLPISTVNRILAGSVCDPRISTLKSLANYFDITVDQLLGYTALPEKFVEKNVNLRPSMVIPLFNLKGSDHVQVPQKWFTWVTQKNDGKFEVFALNIDTNEYEPVFEKDTTLVVEPGMLPPKHLDYLAVKFIDDGILTIKKLFIDGNDTYFMPINHQLKAIPVDEKRHTILGVITEAHTRLRP